MSQVALHNGLIYFMFSLSACHSFSVSPFLVSCGCLDRIRFLDIGYRGDIDSDGDLIPIRMKIMMIILIWSMRRAMDGAVGECLTNRERMIYLNRQMISACRIVLWRKKDTHTHTQRKRKKNEHFECVVNVYLTIFSNMLNN